MYKPEKYCKHLHTYVDRRHVTLKKVNMAFEKTICLDCKHVMDRSYRYLPIVIGKNV